MPAARLPADVLATVDTVVAVRRDLHAHPELSFHEERTARVVADRLRALGLTPRTGVGGHGVTALLTGAAGPGPTVMLRADLDALPVTEAADVPFRSTRPGVMHACGHDGHSAILLGVAEVLLARRQRLRGQVLLVFQPAEELPPGGAAAMLADGVLTDPPVDRAFGLHLWTAAPTGTILVGGGTLWAATAVFRVRLVGRGGHAALPGETLDPVVAAGRLVVALNELVAPGTRALLAVTTVHAGETFNVVPETAELSGTLRAFDRAVLADLATRLTVTASEVAAATGVRAEVEYREGYPPLVNDPALAELVRAACAEVVGAEAVGTAVPSFAGEDFARFAQAVPACFFQVGTANAAADSTWPHHHPRFALDEDALAIGVAALAAVAERALSQDGT